MKLIRTIPLSIILILSIASVSNAQSNRTWGLSAAIQDTQLDFMIPIWTGSNNVMAPGVGVITIGSGGTDLRLGLTDRIYLNTDKNIMPFLGGRAGILMAMPNSGESTTDLVFGLLGGGEYFFSDNFSIGIEAQINFSISDEKSSRFGNPGETNINTASMIFASIYF
jgi:hypothetical protein